MNTEFIARTILAIVLVLLLIIGLIREKRMIRYEQQIHFNNIAEIADKFTRNEILTSNEIRQIIGLKPSDDPKADKLINSNIIS